MANIAISNIAWTADNDSDVFEVMQSLNVTNLEISPFRETKTTSTAQINDLILHTDKFNLRIVSFQALMFRHPELTMFENSTTRQATLKHLSKIIELAGSIGAKTLIFGAPKAKLLMHHNYKEAFAIALEFFDSIAQIAQKNGVVFCIEPTPSIYGADFIRNTSEAMDIINAIDNEGLALNLDIGAMILNGEDITVGIRQNAKRIGHVHVSEPQLVRISLNQNFHREVAGALKEVKYNKIVSIEMKASKRNNLKRTSETINFVKQIYG